MRKIYFALLLTFAITAANAQSFYQKTITPKKLPVTWTGGVPYIVKQTTDQGLIFCGVYFDEDKGENGMFLKKMDANFIVQWSFGIELDATPVPYSLIQTKDGGFVIAGSYNNAPGEAAAFVLRFNKNGKLGWQRYFLQADGTEAHSIAEGPSGSVFVTGKTDSIVLASRCWVAKIERTGTVSLNKTYEIPGYSISQARVVSTTEKAFAILGRATESTGAGTSSFVMKADSLGNALWTNLINEDLIPYRMDISESKNKELTIAASRSSELLTFKFNKSGGLLWSKLISAGGDVALNDLYQLTSNNFLIATTVSGTPNQINVLKLDNATGNILAAKNLKTTAGSTFNFINMLSAAQFTLTGWDASSGTNYTSILNFDSSLANCTDVAATFTAVDYTLDYISSAATPLTGVNPTTALVSPTSWVNPTLVDTLCLDGVLPLNLLSFTIAKNASAYVLSWSTSEEINTSHFDLERGIDINTFAAIGKVYAAKKTTQNNYQFTDTKPLNGTSFYRLKMVDADGRFTYSPIVQMANAAKLNIAVGPNPIQNRIILWFNSAEQTTATVTVTDAQGHRLLTGKYNVPAGYTNQELNAGALKQGTYFVRIETAGDVQVLKIMK